MKGVNGVHSRNGLDQERYHAEPAKPLGQRLVIPRPDPNGLITANERELADFVHQGRLRGKVNTVLMFEGQGHHKTRAATAENARGLAFPPSLFVYSYSGTASFFLRQLVGMIRRFGSLA